MFFSIPVCISIHKALAGLDVDVLTDAQVDYRDYWIDPYLKDVLVVNPMPVVAHKELCS